ncbi:MAG: hypothetical protein KAT65_15900 [Methanophagales archaeon]|nr:hypothetical protein [Methanophagales archaeon]
MERYAITPDLIKAWSQNMIKNDFPRYCGRMFEVLILGLFIKRQIPCDRSLSKIGRWWHKDKGIDIVGLKIECKDQLKSGFFCH